MVRNRMMDKWHYPVLLLVILHSIASYMCMINRTGNSNVALRHLDDFREEHAIKMARYLSAKKEYQTVLNILPDLHRLYPSSETLYVMGAAVTWRLAFPNSERFYDIVPNEAALTNLYMLKFTESLIESDKDTSVVALQMLVARVAAAQAKGDHPSEEIVDNIYEIRNEIQKWIQMDQDEQVVLASKSSQIDTDDESKKVP